MSRHEKDKNPSTTVFFTVDDIKLKQSTNFMKQLKNDIDMCNEKELPVYDFYKGTELDNEKRFVSEIPRQMLRIAYDWVLKEYKNNKNNKIITKTSFRGTTYEIIVILKL